MANSISKVLQLISRPDDRSDGETPPTSLARELATFLTGVRPADLPPLPMDYAAMLIASTLASAALGSGIRSSVIMRDLVRERGGAPQASVWFDLGPQVPITDAARANALMSDAAASDDSDLRSTMHCGTPLTASALAVAEREGATGAEVLAAIVLGYEAAGRIHDASPQIRPRGFHGSALTIFAATVAAGRLLRLDVDGMTHAIGLAAGSSAGLTKAANTSLAREYQAGQAVVNGIEAARAAQRGYTTEERILEMPKGFFEVYGGSCASTAGAILRDGIGASWDIVAEMAVKLAPGGHPYHALAEAAAKAVQKLAVARDQIESIVVSQPGLTALTGPKHPVDLIDMAHSPAYFLAAGAADGVFSWIHASPEKIADPAIHKLIDKVQVGPPPTRHVERYRQGATVMVRTNDGREVTSTVYAPRGAGTPGLDWADIDAKYRALMPHSGLDTERIERSLALVHRLRELETVRPLMALLRRS